MKEYKSIKEMLESTEQRLIEAQKSIIERQKEIEIYLEDCRKALKALDHVPDIGKKVERVPKKGDVLVYINSQYFKNNANYEVIHVDEANKSFDVIMQNEGVITKRIPFTILRNHFRFKDEEPTDEDKANLHSFQHVNQETKKPYRIKTREEMLADGACTDGFLIWTEKGKASFAETMAYLHGKELDTNSDQKIKTEPHHALNEWTIEPWMITENT